MAGKWTYKASSIEIKTEARTTSAYRNSCGRVKETVGQSPKISVTLETQRLDSLVEIDAKCFCLRGAVALARCETNASRSCIGAEVNNDLMRVAFVLAAPHAMPDRF